MLRAAQPAVRSARRALPRRAALLLGGLALVAMPALAQQAAPGGGAGGIPVTTAPVEVGAVPVEIIANGIVASESVVTIRTRVDGQITGVHVQEGQMVRRGQPLFTLDSRQGHALLAEREAALARNRAQLARFQADMNRYQALRGEGFAAQQRFEQAQAEALSAAANVRADEAVIQQIRLNLEFANIVAEADGRLGSLPLRVGNYVRQAENTAMATITQVDPILVNFAVPERWLQDVKAAMAGPTPPVVRVHAEGDAGPPAEGELVFVDSAVDTGTGTILLKARFANPDLRLWPGQYVNVTLVPRVERNAIAIPSAAMQTGQSGRYVYVLQDGVAKRRPVELARTLRDRVLVRGQLAAGEKVIVDGAQRVLDGSRVQERNPPGAAPAPQRVSSATN
ncbi:MAG: efflux RND transporter periplasmic adaptor subunit [Acetobacteraceae bacterium]|nr:efflux RND transporter periplasmic adaptor subunit [Acetobacteraceae bacterium]